MLEPASTMESINNHAWDIFTRKEEYNPNRLDEHGRFRYSCSSYKEIDQPIVSRLLKERGFRVEYPEGKKFALCLTHDVDDVFPPASHVVASSLNDLARLNFRKATKQIAWKIDKRYTSPYMNFQEIMDLEDSYGAKSTFFFMTGSRDIHRYRYDLDDIEDEIGLIVDRGWEIGLHGGYYSYDNFKSLLNEKQALEKIVGKSISGYRGHYLRFKTPDTWRLLSKLGFKYDTTLGYPDAIGFRNGICCPFKPFDLAKNERIGIIEIPLAIMDGTLFGLERSYEGALERVLAMIKTVESCNGVLMVNWHSSNIHCSFRKSWQRIYEFIIEYCNSNNAWITNGMEIADHFEKNVADADTLFMPQSFKGFDL